MSENETVQRIPIEMIDRFNTETPAVIIADRNYESYNTLEHIARKGWKYLIRLREAN